MIKESIRSALRKRVFQRLKRLSFVLFIASFVVSLRLCFVLSLGFLAMLFVAGSLFLVLSGFLLVRFCGMLVCFVVLLVEAFGVHECDCNDGKYILDEQTYF